jgi:hypothetical protein
MACREAAWKVSIITGVAVSYKAVQLQRIAAIKLPMATMVTTVGRSSAMSHPSTFPSVKHPHFAPTDEDRQGLAEALDFRTVMDDEGMGTLYRR